MPLRSIKPQEAAPGTEAWAAGVSAPTAGATPGARAVASRLRTFLRLGSRVRRRAIHAVNLEVSRRRAIRREGAPSVRARGPRVPRVPPDPARTGRNRAEPGLSCAFRSAEAENHGESSTGTPGRPMPRFRMRAEMTLSQVGRV
ncbi:hypothetical protein GCM10022227_29720 [Streptomyces sedi]